MLIKHRLKDMKPPVRYAVLLFLLLLGTTLSAQRAFFGRPSSVTAQASNAFGEPLPLTNTRYRNVNAEAKLVSNGREVFLTWTHGTSSRMNPVVQGASRVGRTIFSPAMASDVIWTGRRFLAVSDRAVRLFDANGEPLTSENAREFKGGYPHLATNGRNVVLLSSVPDTEVQVLTLEGLLTNAPRETIDDNDYAASAIASNGDNYAAVVAVTNGVRLTMLDRDGRVSSQQWISGAVFRRGLPSVGSDRQRYLVAWNHNGGSIRAVFVDASTAAYSAPFILAEPSAGGQLEVSSIVWTGTRYAVAYAEKGTNGSVIRSSVAFLDRDGGVETRVTLHGTANRWHLPTLAIADGRVFASYGTEQGTVVRDVARPSDTPVPAAWSSNLQFYPRAVSSSDATLVTWFEHGPEQQKWWFGIRGTDGSWIERELISDPSTILVASDGHDFLFISHYFWSNEPAVAIRISRDGSVQQIATLPFAPLDVAWNGSHYVVSGRNGTSGDFVVALLGASGSLSAPVTVRQANYSSLYGRPVVASDGRGNTLVVWAELQAFFPVFPPPSLKAKLFDRDLQTASGEPVVVEQAVSGDDLLDVAFDGGRYVAVFPHHSSNGTTTLRARRISAAGAPESGFFIDQATPYNLTATESEEGVAIAWTSEASPVERVAILRRNGGTSLLSPAPREQLFNRDSIALTTLPDRRLGYFYVRTADEEPYYGSARIAMAIAAAAIVPDAPVASVSRASESSLRVTWTAPPQSLSGYRLEYKSGANGEWTELERWFTPEQNETTLFLSGTRPSSYAFRVRAWGDAGTSPYSNEATIVLTKRRAVR